MCTYTTGILPSLVCLMLPNSSHFNSHPFLSIRWQTANAFTTYSALYPKEFGLSIAMAYKFAKYDYPEFLGDDWSMQMMKAGVKLFIGELTFPSVQQVIRVAKDRVPTIYTLLVLILLVVRFIQSVATG